MGSADSPTQREAADARIARVALGERLVAEGIHGHDHEHSAREDGDGGEAAAATPSGIARAELRDAREVAGLCGEDAQRTQSKREARDEQQRARPEKSARALHEERERDGEEERGSSDQAGWKSGAEAAAGGGGDVRRFAREQLARTLPELAAAGEPHGEHGDEHAGDHADRQCHRIGREAKLDGADRAAPDGGERAEHEMRIGHRTGRAEDAAANASTAPSREEEAAHLLRPHADGEKQPGFRVSLLEREDKKQAGEHGGGDDEEEGEADEKLAEIDGCLRRGEGLSAERDKAEARLARA